MKILHLSLLNDTLKCRVLLNKNSDPRTSLDNTVLFHELLRL